MFFVEKDKKNVQSLKLCAYGYGSRYISLS